MPDDGGRAVFVRRLDEMQTRIPRWARPQILVCGGVGTGKTTAVNRVFGLRGVVGHVTRGTTTARRRNLVFDGRKVGVTDMPGLGDSKDRDRITRPELERLLPDIEAFVLMVAPPRPAGIPTLRTAKLLLKHGVASSRIVFGLNRLAMLNLETDGLTVPVEVGPDGPEGRAAISAVDRYRREFLDTLAAGTGHVFTPDQTVLCDALTGWNLHRLLATALERSLPHRGGRRA